MTIDGGPRTILAGTDLGEGSDAVVAAAGRLAAAVGGSVHLLHAFDLEPLPETGGLGKPTFQGRMEAAERALEAQAARCVPAGVEVVGREVVIWAAHRALVERARVIEADVIVVGAHRGALGALLGSTADRVLRQASAPCFVVRGTLTLPLRRVLAATDFSEPAEEAVALALGWAGALTGEEGGEVRLVHVVSELLDVDDGSWDRAVAERALEEAAADLLERLPNPAGITRTPELVPGGAPADALVAYAERWDADLLVAATHGRGAVARALVGSVASSLARRAACPVLLVPPALWRQEG